MKKQVKKNYKKELDKLIKERGFSTIISYLHSVAEKEVSLDIVQEHLEEYYGLSSAYQIGGYLEAALECMAESGFEVNKGQWVLEFINNFNKIKKEAKEKRKLQEEEADLILYNKLKEKFEQKK